MEPENNLLYQIPPNSLSQAILTGCHASHNNSEWLVVETASVNDAAILPATSSHSPRLLSALLYNFTDSIENIIEELDFHVIQVSSRFNYCFFRLLDLSLFIIKLFYL